MSEATKVSPSPRPRTIGVALFAVTSRSGSSSESTTIAYDPWSSATARRVASASPQPWRTCSSIRWEMTSVSVSDTIRRPRRSRAARSSR